MLDWHSTLLTSSVWVTRQIVFDGVVNGLAIGLLAMGIVLVYRATRVINFAVGNMGLIASSMTALLVLNYGWGFWLALGLAVLLGMLFAVAVELSVIRRLFAAPRVTLLVATVGIAQLAQLVVLNLPDIETSGNKYPVIIGSIFDDALGSGVRVRGAQLTTIVVVPVVALALGWLLNRTTFGKTVAAAANNPDLSRLARINPKTVSTFVWAIAGFLSSISIFLLSGIGGGVTGLTFLGPFTLSKAMVAAVLAGMFSFPRAVLAGVTIGVTEALFRFNFFRDPGLIDFVSFLAVLLAVWFQSRGEDERAVFSFTPKVRPIPEYLRQVWWIRNLPRIGMVLLGIFAVVLVQLPGIADVPSRQLLYASVLAMAICGASVTIITGWSGQVSLSQMAFAGLGALFAATLVRGISMDVVIGTGFLPIDALQMEFFPIRFSASPIPFFLAVPAAAVFSAVVAGLIGIGSLRVRGLHLAVTTFVFALAAQQYIYKRPFFAADNTSSVPLPRGSLFGLDVADQRRYYYVCLAVLVFVVALVGRLRRTGVGRTTIAVRDNPDAAACYTVSATRSKLSAFALAGGLAGLGGALIGGLTRSILFSEGFFQAEVSLQAVAMVVIGGIGSVLGAVLGAIWVFGFPTLFDDGQSASLFSSSVGLLLVLMYFPGGLAQIAYSLRDGIVGIAERRLPAHEPPKKANLNLRTFAAGRDTTVTQSSVLKCSKVNVSFGGLKAVTDASIEVCANEIVGLIGTNGAGKSTLMNAIGGYVAATGTVELLGDDLTGLSSAARARAGLGRTFQEARLFPELTVRETVQVALEGRGRTPFLSSALFLPNSFRIERQRRAESDDLIDFLGLGRYADERVSDLSTGTRRIVELAGLLALDAQVLCLDEPTAGVAQRETEAFGPLIQSIRQELGAGMLIVEHDMPLIMNISDRIYCLEAGTVIAEGEPGIVRNDPGVVASYLGTDDRAIARSDS